MIVDQDKLDEKVVYDRCGWDQLSAQGQKPDELNRLVLTMGLVALR